MKKRILFASGIMVVIVVILHSVPTLALRSGIFLHGYPVSAFRAEIEEIDPPVPGDREMLENENAVLYRITPPPVEEATQGHLFTWKVKRKFFIYFASYDGEG